MPSSKIFTISRLLLLLVSPPFCLFSYPCPCCALVTLCPCSSRSSRSSRPCPCLFLSDRVVRFNNYHQINPFISISQPLNLSNSHHHPQTLNFTVIMSYGTGKLNVPLGGSQFGRNSATLQLGPSRSKTVFLKGPLKVLPKIQVDFPLDSEYDFDIVPGNPHIGITVGELVERVIELYNHIYNGGDHQHRSPQRRHNYCAPWLQRNYTDAAFPSQLSTPDYGIYSHDLDELMLVEAEYSPSNRTIYLVVEAV